MGLFRPSRESYGPDPYYQWKTILFAIGAALGLGAIFTEHDWLILVAVPVLAVGVALRWLPRHRGGEATGTPEESEEEAGPASLTNEEQSSSPPDDGEPPEVPPPT